MASMPARFAPRAGYSVFIAFALQIEKSKAASCWIVLADDFSDLIFGINGGDN